MRSRWLLLALCALPLTACFDFDGYDLADEPHSGGSGASAQGGTSGASGTGGTSTPGGAGGAAGAGGSAGSSASGGTGAFGGTAGDGGGSGGGTSTGLSLRFGTITTVTSQKPGATYSVRGSEIRPRSKVCSGELCVMGGIRP